MLFFCFILFYKHYLKVRSLRWKAEGQGLQEPNEAAAQAEEAAPGMRQV